MSALKGLWERAVLIARRHADAASTWPLNAVSLNTERQATRRDKVEAWGKRRWAPRLSDAELLALAERNLTRSKIGLCLVATRDNHGEFRRLIERARRELRVVEDLLGLEHDRPL